LEPSLRLQMIVISLESVSFSPPTSMVLV
jgi:hypothetical protein